MSFFRKLFGLGNDDVLAVLDPCTRMTLLDFVIADDRSPHVRHYFRFKNPEGKAEEFIVVYRREGSGLRYVLTHRRLLGDETEFRTLNERSPWSSTISGLVRLGQEKSEEAWPTSDHFSLQISATSLPAEPVESTPRQETRSPEANAQPGWFVSREADDDDPARPREVLRRQYSFSNLSSPDRAGSLLVECTLQSGGVQPTPSGEQTIALKRSVRFYLRPFRLPVETDFILRVKTPDGSFGGEFDVLGEPIDADTTVFAKFGGRNDTATLLQALMAGRDLSFELQQGDEPLVRLPMQNDQKFKKLWDMTVDGLGQMEAVREQARSSKSVDDLVSQARANPKSHAVWMVNHEQGGYAVLLVKVTPSGEMEHGYYIGEVFSTRDEQQSYALSAARQFGVKLMDVVNQ